MSRELTAAPRASRRVPNSRPATPRRAVPLSVEVPIEGAEALQTFYERLLDLPGLSGTSVVRVLHFGDSHVAADYWTGELRRLLQARFGDAGAGLVMPGRPWRYFRHELVTSLSSSGWETLGLSRETLDGFYGLSGVALSPRPDPLNTNAGAGKAVSKSQKSRIKAGRAWAKRKSKRMRLEPVGPLTAGLEGTFTDFEVQLASFDPGACVSVAVDGATLFAGVLDAVGNISNDKTSVSEPREPPDCTTLDVDTPDDSARPVRVAYLRNVEPLPEGRHALTIDGRCGGAVRLLGADLSVRRPGVVVDTLGINGAEIVALEKWDPPLREALLSRVAPALIIVSYGTNEIGRGDFSFASYKAHSVKILADLKREAADAAILVTGPTDRASRSRKSRALIDSHEELVVRALREAASETGCAFWDAKAAMGGPDAIKRWAAAGLAARDLVHLSGAGYTRLANLLFAQLAKGIDTAQQARTASLSR